MSSSLDSVWESEVFHVKHDEQRIVVVGGGHAGCEAALASARMGIQTILATHRFDRIGEMSCNPAIGGLGKGHLVREIDALDGAMARAADAAGIQFRMLNRRKGPAVRGPRAQCDRKLYRAAMQHIVKSQANLSVMEGEVADLVVSDGRVTGVRLGDGSEISAMAVILTTGTFLRGVIHIGERQISAGRDGDPPSVALAKRIEALGLPLGRLKTGTPPRLDGRTIAWKDLAEQPGDDDPELFSFLNSAPSIPQISCHITHTNDGTHEIIRSNLHRSAMYAGRIDGVGPRYCPSIEDKIVRFADKNSHQIFLEPEGLDDHTVYPNGISTSLPAEVQDDYVRSIKGLEAVKITKPGYAIEYDYVDPRTLDLSLSTPQLPGLYLAGQINGTTGYEEAGAQGVYAGLNASLWVRNEPPLILDRSTSYLGVMIDDLTTRGATEPYRMFTSRAEFRLSLRADNADQRLTPIGMAIGCVSKSRKLAFESKLEKISAAKQQLCEISLTPQQATAIGVKVNQDGKRRNGLDLLGYSGVTIESLLPAMPEPVDIELKIARQVECDATYANYLDRQDAEVNALQRDQAVALPDCVDYLALSGLSREFATKLNQARPSTLAQAGRLEGATPAGLMVLLSHVKKLKLAG